MNPIFYDQNILAFVQQILEAAGLEQGRVVGRLSGGIANHVYHVDETFVVRIGSGSDGPQFPKNASILQTIGARTKAPDLIYSDFSQTTIPFNVLVTSYIKGKPLSHYWPILTPDEQKKIFSKLLKN